MRIRDLLQRLFLLVRPIYTCMYILRARSDNHRALPTDLQTHCGVKVFVLDSRRVLAPAPKVLGSDIKTHLKSRFCAILKKRVVMKELKVDRAVRASYSVRPSYHPLFSAPLLSPPIQCAPNPNPNHRALILTLIIVP